MEIMEFLKRIKEPTIQGDEARFWNIDAETFHALLNFFLEIYPEFDCYISSSDGFCGNKEGYCITMDKIYVGGEF